MNLPLASIQTPKFWGFNGWYKMSRTYFFLTATIAVWASIRFLSSRCLITTGRSIDRKRSLIIPWTESGNVVHFVLIVRSAICRVRGFNIANLLRSCSPSCWSGPSSDRCFRFGGMTAVRWSGLGVLIQMSDQAHNMNCRCQYGLLCFGLSSRSHAGTVNPRQDLISTWYRIQGDLFHMNIFNLKPWLCEPCEPV